MNYQIFVNDKLLLSSNLIFTSIIFFIISLTIFFIIKIVWKKLMAYETLKYEFVTIIAHKFRTPLTQVKWLLEGIIEKEDDSYKKETLLSIEQTNKKLINLTGTLVELTDSMNISPASYDFNKINICEMTSGIVNSQINNFHEKNLFIGIQCSVPEIFIKGDRRRLEFVLQTLLENSINYSRPGRNIDVLISKVGHRAIIKIIDNGIGIDPEDISRIFTKFFRAENAQIMDTEGFGVGLFLAQSIIKHHHGKIEVFSEGIDKGTTFTITFPIFR